MSRGLRPVVLTTGETLRLIRRRGGIVQRNEAKRLRVHRNVLSAWEWDRPVEGRPVPKVKKMRPAVTAWELCMVLRWRSKMGQAGLAEAMGVSHVTLRRMECGLFRTQRLINYWREQGWQV